MCITGIEQLLKHHDAILFPDAYRTWIEQVYSENAWNNEPDEIFASHCAWKDAQKAARWEAVRRAGMSVKRFRDEDETTTSLTRDGEMGLSVLPVRTDSHLLDGQSLDRLADHARGEALDQGTIPVPRSWSKWLGDDFDDDGRIKLMLRETEQDVWHSADGRFQYSVLEGLKMERDADDDEPASRKPH